MSEASAHLEDQAEKAAAPAGWHYVLARTLTVIGIVVLVVSILANFVKREALDTSHFRETSRMLVADPEIRDQVGTTMVDALYQNVDVQAALADKLPKNLQSIAGPIAGATREASNTAAKTLLERPRVQSLFVNAAVLAQQELVALLDQDTKYLDSTNGQVVLDLRPLVLRLGSRFSIVPNLESQVPAGAARIVILKSDELKTAQRATRGLRFVASWIWVLVLLLWAGAIWLARGRRRIEVRAIAAGVVAAGLLLLVIRTLAGRYLVNHFVVSDSVRPAVQHAYDIITRLLKGAGWTAVIVGVVALVGVWLAGPGRRATASREWLAPYLRRPGIAYGSVLVAYLLLLWWKPTPQFAFLLNVVLFLAFLLLGLEALRRLAAREFPDAEPRAVAVSLPGRRAEPAAPPAASGADELERLTRLHTDGALDDAEFAAAKAKALGPAG